MNILLIGHEGYLGRGLAAWFRRGHRVVGWDKQENLFNLTTELLVREKIDFVVNGAVYADLKNKNFVLDSLSDELNVKAVRHLVEILRGTDIGLFHFSTREVLIAAPYGPDDVVRTPLGYRPKWYVDENTPYAPRHCYGKSKVISELIAEAHPRANIVRLTSPYTDDYHVNGGWPLLLMKTIVKGGPVTLTNGGEQFRDPLHTDDLAHLIELLAERQAYGERIHAGGGEHNLISLREFVQLADPAIEIKEAPGGDLGFAFDNTKAHRLTGWEPQVRFRDKIPVIRENVRRALAAS